MLYICEILPQLRALFSRATTQPHCDIPRDDHPQHLLDTAPISVFYSHCTGTCLYRSYEIPMIFFASFLGWNGPIAFRQIQLFAIIPLLDHLQACKMAVLALLIQKSDMLVVTFAT